MGLFRYEQISKLNESEFAVYNYVFTHLGEMEGMSIRGLSKAAGVSTTTVLRFCGKMGCEGYTEFKYKVQQFSEKKPRGGYFSPIQSAIGYIQNAIDDRELEEKIERAARICLKARQVLFFGIGASGGLGEFGARIFCSVGITAFSMTDPFYPSPAREMDDTVLFVLSVSGETPMVVTLVDNSKMKEMKIISITNIEQCTIARLSELNFTYYMPFTYAYQEDDQMNMTTQVPVLFLLELLSCKIHDLREAEERGAEEKDLSIFS